MAVGLDGERAGDDEVERAQDNRRGVAARIDSFEPKRVGARIQTDHHRPVGTGAHALELSGSALQVHALHTAVVFRRAGDCRDVVRHARQRQVNRSDGQHGWFVGGVGRTVDSQSASAAGQRAAGVAGTDSVQPRVSAPGIGNRERLIRGSRDGSAIVQPLIRDGSRRAQELGPKGCVAARQRRAIGGETIRDRQAGWRDPDFRRKRHPSAAGERGVPRDNDLSFLAPATALHLRARGEGDAGTHGGGSDGSDSLDLAIRASGASDAGDGGAREYCLVSQDCPPAVQADSPAAVERIRRFGDKRETASVLRDGDRATAALGPSM